jgi:hypothetical protein
MSNLIKNELPSSCHPPPIPADPAVTTCPENGGISGDRELDKPALLLGADGRDLEGAPSVSFTLWRGLPLEPGRTPSILEVSTSGCRTKLDYQAAQRAQLHRLRAPAAPRSP